MATVLGQLFLDTIAIMEIDNDPTILGTPANQGSLAIETGSGNMWRKVGPADTDWVEVFVNQSAPGNASQLQLRNGNNSISIGAPSLSSNVNLTLPNSSGVEGQQLTVQSSGQLSWSNRNSFHPGLINGRYYGSPDLIDAWTTLVVLTNRLYASLLYVPYRTNITRIGLEVTTAQAGAQARLGLYEVNDNNGEPGSLIVDGGLVSANTIGLKEVVVNLNLNPGWYYMAAAFVGTPSVRAVLVNAEIVRSLIGTTAPNSNNHNLNVAFTFGPLPSSFPTATYSNTSVPWLWVRSV